MGVLGPSGWDSMCYGQATALLGRAALLLPSPAIPLPLLLFSLPSDSLMSCFSDASIPREQRKGCNSLFPPKRPTSSTVPSTQKFADSMLLLELEDCRQKSKYNPTTRMKKEHCSRFSQVEYSPVCVEALGKEPYFFQWLGFHSLLKL